MSWLTQIVSNAVEGNAVRVKEAVAAEMEERTAAAVEELRQEVAQKLFGESTEETEEEDDGEDAEELEEKYGDSKTLKTQKGKDGVTVTMEENEMATGKKSYTVTAEVNRRKYSKTFTDKKAAENWFNEALKRSGKEVYMMFTESVEELVEAFKKGVMVVHPKTGATGKVVNVSSDKSSVDVKWTKKGYTTSHDVDELELMKESTNELDETSHQDDLDEKKPVIVHGVKGARSKPFKKKFRNFDAFQKWLDKPGSDDYEVHTIENE